MSAHERSLLHGRIDGHSTSSPPELGDVLNEVNVAVIIVSHDHRVAYANRYAALDFQLDIGSSTAGLLPASIDHGLNTACLLRRADGRSASVEISSSLIVWNGDRCRLVTIRDVSAHRRAVFDVSNRCEAAESRLATLGAELDQLKTDLCRAIEGRDTIARDFATSEERFRAAFEQGPIGKAIVDDGLQFVQANRAFCEMFGYSRAEICARHVVDLIHPEDVCVAIKRCRRAFQRSLPHVVQEARCVAKDGHTLHVRVTSMLLSTRPSSPPSVLFHIEDRTEQVRISERARVSERLAAIGSLAAGVAHEINNPVGAALLSAESALRLLDRADDTGGVRRCLENIRAAMLRCGQISHKTLRILSANRELQLCQMGDLVRRAVDQVRWTHSSATAAFVMQIEPVLPDVRLNELEIELVLVNLITNSVQNGRPGLQVTISVEIGDHQNLKITVADNGPGMSRDQLDSLFHPFFTTRSQTGGSGIGMSVVQRIVSDHGGTISVASAPHQGTQVTITLPAEVNDTLEPGQSDASTHHRGSRCLS